LQQLFLYLFWGSLRNHIETQSCYALDIAKEEDDQKVIDLHKKFMLQLIFNKTPPDERQSKVMQALKWKLYDTAKLLIESGEPMNFKNIYEREEIIRLLMPKCCYDGSSINIDRKHCCSHMNYVNIIKEELSKISIPSIPRKL